MILKNNIPQGYKQTELGIIPEDWEVKTIASLGDIVGGGTPSTTISEYWDGDIAWCTPSDITSTDGKYIFKTERCITEKGLKNSAATVLPTNSILLCTRATIGELKLSGIPMATNQGFKNLHSNGSGSVDYLFYILQTKKKDMIELAIGSTFLEISKKALCSIPLQTPPIAEQEYIAEALSDVDSMISSLEKLIIKKKAIKQGAMQELLTEKKRLPGFTGEWIKVQLKDIFDFYKGNGLSKEKVSDNGKNACILYGELFTRYTEVIGNITNKTNSDEGLRSCKFDVLMPGSTTTNGLDLATASVIMDNDVLLGGDIVVLRPKKEMDTRIFGYLLRTMPKEILQHTQGITIVHLNTKTFREMEVLIPKTVEEQTAIADILADMDNEIEALEQKFTKTRQIKQGMMQQLLTGKIRLV